MIPGVNKGEQLDRFCQGLKPNIRLEVLKSGARSMDKAARIALNEDSAMFGADMLPFQFKDIRISVHVLMDRSYGNRKCGEAKESGWKRFFSQKVPLE